jgi:uncharacterized protein
MILELKKLFNGELEKIPFSGSLDWSEEEYFGCRPFSAPVQISGTASNTSGIVRLQYQAATALKMPCDRCAVETEREFVREFEHTLVADLNGEDTGELLVLGERLQLDVDELALSDMILEFPAKFLCREDCRGLCSGCGANLNEEECHCPAKPTDPRLEILKTLLS